VSVEAVLLDLDGTLADTAPDLVRVLNHLLIAEGLPRMPYAIARNEVSNGASGLLRLGFGEQQTEAELETLRARFLADYAENICVESRLFIDIDSISHQEDNIRWGIVTNKPEALTLPLLLQLGIHDLPGCVISGDRLPQRKPHPAPLHLAAAQLEVAPARCVYVGDAPRDIEAGRAAGMATIAAAYGYIRPRQDPRSWGADLVIRRPRELPDALRALSVRAAP
jgi:phosphoglycolate phosphatase